jgi:hypothetical protein
MAEEMNEIQEAEAPAPASAPAAPIAEPAEDVGDDTLDIARNAIKTGFTVEEAQRLWNLTDDEVAQLGGGHKPGKLTVAQEIADIEKVMRTNRAEYNEKHAQRYAELLKLQEQHKEKSGERPQEEMDRLAAIAKALHEIDQTRRSRRSDVTQEMEAQELALLEEQQTLKLNMGGLPKSVRDEWSKNGALEKSLQTARATAEQAFAELGDEQADFVAGFDDLPEGAQASVYKFIAIEPSTSWRPASEHQIKQLAELDPGLVQLFGAEAPRRLGQLAGRYRLMLQGMSAEDRAKTEAWVDNLSPAQRRAVAKCMTR